MPIKSEWLIGLIFVLAGSVFTLAFAPFEQSYAALLAAGVCYAGWQGCMAGRAWLRGFLFGIGAFGLGVSWVYVSIHDYGGASVWGAGLLTVVFVLFWALFPALTAWLFNRLSLKPFSIKNAVLFAVIWDLVEYGRGEWLLNGFPWLQTGYSQLASPLAGYIPVAGVYGVGFLLLLTGAVLVNSLQDWRAQAKWVGVCGLIWLTGFGLQSIEWTHGSGQSLKAVLIQGNIPQDKKWLSEVRIQTLRRYRELSEQQADADLIIWPETAIPAYQHQVEDFYLKPLVAWAKKTQTVVVAGIPGRNAKTRESYNKVITLGAQRGAYLKKHLLPFGEYLPLQPVSGWVLDALGLHLGRFTPGDENQALPQVKGVPFALSICYEDAFASVFLPTLPQATFLVNVTNDAWFGHSIEPWQHMQIAQARALETGRYLLRATNTGITAVVNSKGQVVAQAPAFKEAVLSYRFEPRQGMTPFVHLGNDVIVILITLIGGGILFRGKVFA